ncbi:DMT family transporter [Phocaeicola oris]|uniref:DMT family transporter n=1 Tax=Phocaeicola oris TaxID=2896850 RepID=UPI00234E4875|nr:DMT family transporter [Phocaeicola oris]MCE2616183.1 DMT family transporter [Phocaeicola oris]
MKHKALLYHIIAILTVVIWGVTFINSKILLNQGLQAHELFLARFFLAYICIWFISPRKLFAVNLKDEFLLFLLGITGGSLYFVAENTALTYTLVNNVSFIVCSSPLIATLMAIAVYKEVKATVMLMVGSVIALIGVGMVIFNGHFVLKLNPIGDVLALTASVAWAVYSLLIKKLSGRYSAVFITRKVFFYGIMSVLPIFIFMPWQFPLSGFFRPSTLVNYLFLAVVASFICFLVWSWVIKKLGALRVTNYIYLNPVSTMIASAIFLHEPMNIISYIGCFLILAGVFCAGKGTKA